MFKVYILFVFLLCFFRLNAQELNVAHITKSFFDEGRNRNIDAEIYYPAENTGENIPVANGQFPLIVFGHGFLMPTDAYENFWSELVPCGYIICFPNTETGMSPDIMNFGLDLRFVASQMQNENNNNNSLFHNSITSKTAIMGHSMGGGASFLAAQNQTNISTVVGFAPAETIPSAIEAASNTSASTLIFSGNDDCITPPAENQVPIYDALSSSCKTHITINSGIHCYFANYNLYCEVGEATCNPSIEISRTVQQDITFNFLGLWLDFWLNENSNSFDVFNDSLYSSTRISFTQNCNSALPNIEREIINITPNPFSDAINIDLVTGNQTGQIIIFDVTGKVVYQAIIDGHKNNTDLSYLANGFYLLKYIDRQNNIIVTRLIIKQTSELF